MMSASMKQKICGSTLLLTAALLWGSSFAVRKMALEDIGPLMQNFFRFLVGFCFMVVLTVIYERHRKKKIEIDVKRIDETKKETSFWTQIKYGAIVGSAFGIGSALQQIGLMTVDAGKTGFLTAMYTVLVPIISFLLFREKIKKQVWIGALFSLVGLYLIAGGVSGFEPGYLILLAGAFCFAMQIILLGKLVSGGDPMLMVTAQIGVCTVVNGLIALFVGEPFSFDMLGAAMVPILYTGIFSIGIANAFHFISQTMIPSSIAAIGCSFESVFALLFGILLLDEHMAFPQLAGCLLIFVAMIVSQVEFGEKKGISHSRAVDNSSKK